MVFQKFWFFNRKKPMKKTTDIFKVCLMGASLETGNMGVSALATSIVKNIVRIRPTAEIFFLIGNKKPGIKNLHFFERNISISILNYRLSPLSKINEHLFMIFAFAIIYRITPFAKIKNTILAKVPWLKILSEADFIGDIHGGDSFSDIYGLKRMMIQVLPNLIVFILKKNLVLLPQTYGPFNTNISKQIARFVLKRSDRIFSRDNEGIGIVKNLIGNLSSCPKIDFCPDVAFTLDPEEIKVPGLSSFLSNNEEETTIIGFNINGLMYNGGYTKCNMFGLKGVYKNLIYNLIFRLLEEGLTRIILVPHTFGPSGNINSDLDAALNVLELLPVSYRKNIYLVKEHLNQSQLKKIIGFSEFFVGSRMHACIAALSQKIPTIGIAYSKKFSGVFESIGLPEMVADARYLNEDQIIQKIMHNYHNRNNIKNRLPELIDACKIHVYDTFVNKIFTWN